VRRLEVALWGAGLVLIALFFGIRLDAALGRKAALSRFEAARASLSPSDRAAAWSSALSAFDSPDKKLWSPDRVRGFDASLSHEFAPPLAILRIPKIDLEVPVLAGTDELALNRGVGHIAGTPRPGQPGNVGIAGHRDGFFRGLKDVAAGDSLEIESLSRTDRYRIESITIVSPDRVDVLAPTASPVVTLVTCFPFYYVGSAPQRYIVRAALDEPAQKVAERRIRAP
jgi:sortase A